MRIVDKLKAKLRGSINLDRLKGDGLQVGINFNAQEGVIIDPGHCWLVKIGDNVTLAPRVHILAHDASTKMLIGYTKIAQVLIGNYVFVGAGSIVLPGVTIGDNVVVGAGSVVTKDLASNGVYAGNPARMIISLSDWLDKKNRELTSVPVFGKEFKVGRITEQQKEEMKKIFKKSGSGYIV